MNLKQFLKQFIDFKLNYGRPLIRKFVKTSMPFSSILDIGAGHGDDLLYAKEVNPDAKLFALESYPPYIDELRAKGITVYSTNIETTKFPFENESVDIVIINQVFEHVKEVFWIMEEITRVLSKDGHLIVGVPNLASFHNRLLLLFGIQPTTLKNDSAHLRGYTLNDFRNLVNSGFPNGYTLEGYGGGELLSIPVIYGAGSIIHVSQGGSRYIYEF